MLKMDFVLFLFLFDRSTNYCTCFKICRCFLCCLFCLFPFVYALFVLYILLLNARELLRYSIHYWSQPVRWSFTISYPIMDITYFTTCHALFPYWSTMPNHAVIIDPSILCTIQITTFDILLLLMTVPINIKCKKSVILLG